MKNLDKSPKENKEKITPREITEELKESYLDYAMSVIVSRALPDVRDGLKPVQRRILWAMWDMGLTAGAKFMKSARVTGETMGKYHPHGDIAVYDSLVRMAQDFSLRYPLIQGQGNFGSLDGDAAAAQRYTEVRLAKIAETMLNDVEKETVDWQSNYDNSRLEPKYLPAKLPNLLLNGVMGIAVGMATNIPPHNLKEIADAIIYLIDHSQADLKEIFKIISGPDFPTGAIIYGRKNLEEAYRTGRGSITVRATAEIEERKGGYQIVISEIPYQVNKSDLLIKIAELVQKKKIEGIKDLRDESDREGMRIVIELKSDIMPQKILNQLYQYTELQKNFYFNMLALIDGIQPQVLSLKEILLAYLEHRKKVIRRRTEFDLKKTEERAHILIGLVKALEVIDKVIALIKKSKDRQTAEENLIKTFKLTKIQANAILEMKLQSLAALERQKIEDELKEKKKLIAELQLILKEPKKIIEIIKKDLTDLKEKFPEGRRTKIISDDIQEFQEEDLISEEEVIITLSADGYIKRMPIANFKSQKRGGKGIIGSELKEEDKIQQIALANTHDNILFFTNRGRVFQTKAFEIPAAGRLSKGKSIHNFLEIPADEKIAAFISYPKNQKGYLILATKNGLIKKTLLAEFQNIRRTGIIALKLIKDDELIGAKLSSGQDEIIIVSLRGKSIRFSEKEARPMSRTASGITAIKLAKNDTAAAFDIIKNEAGKTAKIEFLIATTNGFAKRTFLKEYKRQHRGGKGIRAIKITEKTGLVIYASILEEVEEILAFSAKGQALRTNIKEVRLTGRSAQGVRIMNIDKDDKLTGVVCL